MSKKVNKKSILQKESERYSHKGFGAAFAILQIALFCRYWPDLAQSFWKWSLNFMQENQISPELYYILFGVPLSVGLQIIFQGFFYLCYCCDSVLIDAYKCIDEPWPWAWNAPDREGWNRLYWRTFALYSFNMFVLVPIAYTPHYIFDVPLMLDLTLEGIPDITKLAAQLLFCVLMEDLTFHFSHRMLHTPFLYHWIHKVHHEHKVTIGVAGQYFHPIEFIFGSLIPVQVGPALLGTRIHFVAAFTWYSLRYIESVEGHSGYDFSWSPFRMIPFGADYAYHAYHHSHNIGNFSSFLTVWDTIFGSNKVYYEQLEDLKKDNQGARLEAVFHVLTS